MNPASKVQPACSHRRLVAVAVLMFATGLAAVAQGTPPASDLAAQFAAPPMAAKPHVMWHWMGADFSKPGITKDLEAMQELGIGGAEIFNLGAAIGQVPWPEQTYRGQAYWEAMRHTLAEAKRLGIEISLIGTPGYSTTGGPWIGPERGMQKVVWSITETEGGKQLSLALPAISGGALGRGIAVLAVPLNQAYLSVKEVVDVTAKTDAAGTLTWQAPPGKWKIYRFGHAPTGKAPHPIPEDLVGHTFEVDKMSAEHNQYNWQNVLGPIKQHLAEYVGNTLKSISIDSYESGDQNWTAGFREEFIKRKGYDPVPWLVTLGQPLVHTWFFDANRHVSMYALAGPTTYATELSNPALTVLGSAEETKRFEWDYRDVISGLFFDNGWKVAKQMMNESGLEFRHECYRGPFDRNQGVTASDVPTVEFWTEKGNVNAPPIFPSDIGAAQAAGKALIASEALTGSPNLSMWTEDPACLKIFCDEAYAQGVNRFILHHWTQQPFDDKYQPGRTMYAWGTHFGRHQTWFEPGKAFFAYLGRCQTLLQQGERVMDYLCMDQLDGEADVIAKDVFLQSEIKVKDGNIVLPTGRSYAFMVFSRDGAMLPEVAQKIKAMVAAGATVVSTRPNKSPSLKDYPQCEEALRQLGDEVWGTGTENRYQNGYVFAKVEDARKKLNLKSDYTIEKASVEAAKVMVLHRRNAEVDLYYIANQSDKAQDLLLSFRIAGKQPELWQAEDGTMTDAPVWHEQDGRTCVDLHLKGVQTIFVVFRKAASQTGQIVAVDTKGVPAVVVMKQPGVAVLRSATPVTAEVVYSTGKKRAVALTPEPAVAVTGDWAVTFAPKLGAPFTKTLPELIDFSKAESKEVKYFSGSATYRKKIALSAGSPQNRRTVLDLGLLNDIAQVRINGKDAGVLWYPPYTADITDCLKAGDNQLEIVVTNNWANQLIGDEQEPRDFEVGANVDFGAGSFGGPLTCYPEWFIKNQPRPSRGRKTFTTWLYFTKDSAVQPAGLVGPVRLVMQAEQEL
ncbi:MAG: glycosyl hydrolase [Verrucomicrobia bacterium]|nr:glycosyl hydrolase [Verrucomicrobiota bacterium]